MTTEVTKKKSPEHRAHPEEKGEKSKGVNRLLWLVAIVLLAVAAVGNTYFASRFALPVRVILLAVLLVGAVAAAAFTNQGQKAIRFAKESRLELRKIVWPTRPEAMQTTLIVIAFALVVSLGLWAIDSVVVSIITFLTELKF